MHLKTNTIRNGLACSIAVLVSVAASANTESDKRAVSALDTEYQAAVKRNDARTMDRILASDFVVVLGNGKTIQRPTCSRWHVQSKSITSIRRRRNRLFGFGVTPPS